MSYLLIVLLYSFVLFISVCVGDKIAEKFELCDIRFNGILGFSVIQSVLFLIYIPLSYLECNGLFVNAIFWMIMIALIIFSGIPNFKKYSKKDLFLFILYLMIMCFLSARVTLGEQQGDSTWYFSMVIRNIDADHINCFNAYNGLTGMGNTVGILYKYQSFYQFFSALLLPIKYLFPQIRLFAVNMWVANMLFYTFTFEILLNIYYHYKSKLGFICSILFVGLYVGNYIYNLSLPHMGIIFMGLIISDELNIFHQYLESSSNRILMILFYILANFSLASSGLFLQFFIVFSIILYYLINKIPILDKIPILSLPFIIYGIIYFDSFLSLIILVLMEIMLFLVCIILKLKCNEIHYPILGKIVLFITFAAFFILSMNPAISINFIDFFKDESQFALTQNYFDFSSFLSILKTMFYYFLIGIIIIKNRGLSKVLLIILLCFVNPFVYPAVAYYLTDITVYHRVFYIIFCFSILAIGINTVFIKFSKKLVKYMILTLSFGFASWGVFQTRSSVYLPSGEYSPLLKMDNRGIAAIDFISNTIDIESLNNPKIVSQFFGTNIVETRLYNITGADVYKGFTIYDQDSAKRKLFEIFYNPIFYTDESIRYESDYLNACQYLEEERVDFILIDKDFSVINDYGDWVSLEWMVHDCADKTYENEKYSVYRFYW